MISAIVIIASIVLAAAFSIAWLLLPGFRRAVERPKHSFQDQVTMYDRQCHDSAKEREAFTNESR